MRNRSFANPTTGSSEKKKRNPLTKLAVDSIDADCNGPVSFELRRAANSLRA
ncbi:hypothetical protein BOX15_Mlig033479g1 [Macrostomum lignano]|uniref:Uncharacterized protein n=1 Tax=Macrostomum lignano TaxID=282301 RepID=A0A267FZS7_9PLAT|nr:hypothetical protein BOX15_Mlig033479g1 [Macrostomum lignano]